MKPHDHDHAHGHLHGHTHHQHVHNAAHGQPAAPQSSARTHDHAMPKNQAPTSLLMTSSGQRVLGALGLIALLWLAVAWAVLFID